MGSTEELRLFLLIAHAAQAASPMLDLGLGVRRLDSAFDGNPSELQASARLGFGGNFGVEADLAYGPGGIEPSGLTQTLVAVAYEGNSETTFQQPIRHEAGALGVVFVASPWKAPRTRGISAWPVGVVGLEARLVQEGYARINPDYAAGVEGADPAAVDDTPTTSVLVGPCAGLAFEVWFWDRGGVRIGARERLAWEQEPDYGNRLPNGDPAPLESGITASTVATIDALVRF